jgi:hypothetical protein
LSSSDLPGFKGAQVVVHHPESRNGACLSFFACAIWERAPLLAPLHLSTSLRHHQRQGRLGGPFAGSHAPCAVGAPGAQSCFRREQYQAVAHVASSFWSCCKALGAPGSAGQTGKLAEQDILISAVAVRGFGSSGTTNEKPRGAADQGQRHHRLSPFASRIFLGGTW